MTKRPHSVPADSLYSPLLLQRSIPNLISLQNPLFFPPHLRSTEVDLKSYSFLSQSVSISSRKQLPLFTLKLSSQFEKALLSKSAFSRQESNMPKIVASSLQSSPNIYRTISNHDLEQNPFTSRLPLRPPLYAL